MSDFFEIGLLINSDEVDSILGPGMLTCAPFFFRLIFMKMGEEVSDEEIEEIIRLADKDGDGKLGWDDFHAVMIGAYD